MLMSLDVLKNLVELRTSDMSTCCTGIPILELI
uniref:Uncharacterized protein n=1 Tax=Arundo donax TaxID=35708 RepID=A0A0A8YP51_ARUDO